MADVLVRELAPKTVENLNRSAKRHRRSLQAEMKSILESASVAESVNHAAVARRIRKRLMRKGVVFEDSVEILRKIREERGR